MQTAISLEAKVFPVRTTEVKDGAVFPAEAQGYREDYANGERSGGFFDLSPFGVVEVSGRDATDYLQRMSSLNVKQLAQEEASWGALLTARAHIVSLGYFLKIKPDTYQIIVSPGLTAKTAEHLEQFHFGEVLTIVDQSSAFAILGWWKPSAEMKADLALEFKTSQSVIWRRWQSIDLEIWADSKIPELYWLKVSRGDAAKIMFEWGRLGVPLLGMKVFDFLRVRAGRAWVGEEISDKEIILEANWEEAISRNKGCYPGQEVVERIFTYGKVNRKLLRVELENPRADFPAVPFSFSIEGQEAGEVRGWQQDPENACHALGLAMVKKAFWDFAEPFAVGDVQLKITELL